MNYLAILIPAMVGVIGLLLIGFIFTRLYKRATRETALVRTGAGGLQVIQDGGCLVVPGLHDILRVNMKTMNITVNGGEGLITKDSRRVDVIAEFFIRVEPNTEAIANAAQSLGAQTNDIAAIRSLIEGKVQDTMRAITAQMDLADLHRSRSDFVQRVQNSLNEDLKPNGLKLESVALTRLDETDIKKLDPNNTFDVIGMRARAEIVTEQTRERARIEEAGKVEVARTEQGSRLQLLEIERDEAKATEEQSVTVAEMRAQSEQKRARLAEATAKDLELAQLERKQAVETANIEHNQKVELAEIQRRQAVEAANIRQRQEIEIANQKASIEIERQSEAKSQAQAEAAKARADAVTAEEAVETARATAAARRDKEIAVIAAEREAETATKGTLVTARVNREAAEDEAIAILAKAKAEAEAVVIRAEAEKAEGLARAEATRAMVDADNSIASQIIDYRLREKMIEVLPQIIAEMVAPIRHVDSIRVNQITGLNGLTAGGAGSEDSGSGGVVDQLGRVVRENAVALPVLRQIAGDLQVDIGEAMNAEAVLKGFSDRIAGKTAPEAETPAAPAAPAEPLDQPRRDNAPKAAG